MKRNVFKKLLSIAVAIMITCTGVITGTAQVVAMEYDGITSIENCATNIKSIYKAKYPEQTEMIEGIVNTLSSSDEFASIFENEGATAFQIIEDSLRDVLEPSIMPCMQTDDLYISEHAFPRIQQVNEYYCGPASVLMALIGGGAENYYYTYNESITDNWQTSLASTLETNEDSGTYISKITGMLNANIPSSSGYTYKTKAFTVYSYQLARNFIETSLSMDAVPVIKVDTAYLDYYNGESSGHYMVVESVDFNAECVTLIDPHYDNRYFGAHTISFEEFDYLVRNSRDFWVSVYTNVSSGAPYEYN